MKHRKKNLTTNLHPSGNRGDGTLDHNIGIGEYLDKHAIETARVRAGMMGPTRNRLSVVSLTLTGFVVDADPFYLWFNPGRLRRIHFRNDCVDAGFCLPESMRGGIVTVDFPRQVKEHAVTIRAVDAVREVKLVELRGGQKVWEWDFGGYRGGRIWDGFDLGLEQIDGENSTSLDLDDDDDDDIAVFPEEHQEQNPYHVPSDVVDQDEDTQPQIKKTKTDANHNRKLQNPIARNKNTSSHTSLRHIPSPPSTLPSASASASASARRHRSGALLHGRRAIGRIPRWWGGGGGGGGEGGGGSSNSLPAKLDG
ncbi:hypothetical protein VTN02DRAFT_1798 [Thermoascus thermophilus]